jgi:hypothetical protein
VALTTPEEETVRRLRFKLDQCQRDLRALDDYYELRQKLVQLGLAVPPNLQGLLTLVNWPRITVDTVERRLDIEGFQLPDTDEGDADLWAVWQANGMDLESQLAHVDAMVMGRSYVTVSSPDVTLGEADAPLIRVESAREVMHEVSPRSREVTAALKVMRDDSTMARTATTLETLYLPDVTIWYETLPGSPRREVDRDEHRLGRCPVVPLVNRARVSDRMGVSEMTDIIPLTDSVGRVLTNSQVAAEILAVPQRYAAGMTKADFTDPRTGEPVDTWKTYFGAFLMTANADAKFGQFDAANLGNFDTLINTYAHQAAAVTGLSTRHFGINSANPPSADAIRADEAGLIVNAQRKNRAYGESWELVMRMVRRFMDGQWRPELARMETLWRNPATPSVAQQADATVKLFQAGVIPREAAWMDLGYSAERRKRLKQMFAEQETAAPDPTLERIARGLTGEPPTPNAAPQQETTSAPAPVGA